MAINSAVSALSRAGRAAAIKKIEDSRESTVLTYITGDRPGFQPAQIGEDTLTFFYELLPEEKVDRLDLFLYSRGGAAHVPWKIVSLFREHCKEFNVLVPFKAHSAATMLALGADNIVCGAAAELGPIDPTLTTPFNPKDKEGNPLPVGTETINSFHAFLTNYLKLEREDTMKGLDGLFKEASALGLGEIYRQHNYIRMTAKKLMETRNKAHQKQVTQRVIKSLVEEMYYHGHAINRHEAKRLGLPVIDAPSALEKDFWALYKMYESDMKLASNFTPLGISAANNFGATRIAEYIAFVESSKIGYGYRTEMNIEVKRQLPPNVNINLNFQVPDAILQQLQQNQAAQNLLQLILQAANQELQQQILASLNAQAPIIGVQAQLLGSDWEKQ